MAWILLLAVMIGSALFLVRSAPPSWRRWIGHSPVGVAFTTAELVLIAILLNRAPEFRTPYGFFILVGGMGLIHWRGGQMLGIFRKSNQTPVAPPPATGPRGTVQLLGGPAQVAGKRARRKVMDPAGLGRYLYPVLAILYFVVISLVLLIRIYTKH